MPIRLQLPKNGKRLIYDLGPFGLPELPYLAAQNLPHSTAGLPEHMHKDRMEINHIIKGERVYRVQGRDYHLKGNELFFTFPDELHGSGTYLHGRGLHFWVQVELPRPGSGFLDFQPERARPLLEALWNIRNRHCKADPQLQTIYLRILQLCHLGPSPIRNLELSTLLSEWFLLIVKCSETAVSDNITPDIARALALISKNSRYHMTLSEMSDAACLSESRFIGKFKQQMGMPPGEYLLRKRIEEAANELMMTRRSITDIALAFGFSSSQHFSVTFKKFFGLSPQGWLKNIEEDSLLYNRGCTSAQAGQGEESVRPWLDDNGLLHGYVPVSYKGGKHPT